MRLDKYIATSTDYSRSETKYLIKKGNVLLNSRTAYDPGQKIRQDDLVSINGDLIYPLQPRYFMLNKAVNYVCATTDSEHPTVLDLIDEPQRNKLHIAGRLDRDTTGLVLITDDGQWTHRITSPNKRCYKYYRVTLDRDLQQGLVDIFSRGIALRGEQQATQPARLNIVDDNVAELAIHEGKYHQVKRMFAACNYRVTALHRFRIGDIFLDENLTSGRYRPLTAAEVMGA
ncbi:MAG: pseudouridine synthase [Pseudomonadota bacterium]